MESTVVKIFKFEAAHKLPFHRGQCRNLHGHSYKAEVMVTGEVQTVDQFNSESGMVIDFGRLSHIWKTWLEPILDHGEKDLNHLEDPNGMGMIYPTAENLAKYIFQVFKMHMNLPDTLEAVKLWETDSGYVLVTE